MPAPKLSFELNQELDIEIALEFQRNPEHGGVDFWQDRALFHHPRLRHADLAEYVHEYYREHAIELERRQKEIAAMYRKNPAEIERLQNLFKGYAWPAGKYICYISIFDFGPRFLSEKTFQVFAFGDDRHILFTIEHELLHFLFYAYCQKKFPHLFAGANTESGPFWDLAEIFNAIVQGAKGYPDHRDSIRKLKRHWHGDVDEWIREATS